MYTNVRHHRLNLLYAFNSLVRMVVSTPNPSPTTPSRHPTSRASRALTSSRPVLRRILSSPPSSPPAHDLRRASISQLNPPSALNPLPPFAIRHSAQVQLQLTQVFHLSPPPSRSPPPPSKPNRELRHHSFRPDTFTPQPRHRCPSRHACHHSNTFRHDQARLRRITTSHSETLNSGTHTHPHTGSPAVSVNRNSMSWKLRPKPRPGPPNSAQHRHKSDSQSLSCGKAWEAQLASTIHYSSPAVLMMVPVSPWTYYTVCVGGVRY
ncbi:hypothetical protein EX30DRAFT_266130 [Ascodesmis nigricans]|uniref:Uncharacterized protein n=1 Tax=Ascodesmis nigricans TaxID=341454 RepID=A0A4S2MHL7_9PEZI|nr:hypothetical protein EX30DRAFT_266130 [Ascodesmis nigricans]